MVTLNYSSELRRPNVLYTVAVVFFAYGVFSALEILLGLPHGRITLNMGVLGLFVGPGIWRLKRGWRTYGLVMLWLTMIPAPFFAIALLATRKHLTVNFLSVPVGYTSPLVGLVVIVVIFAVALWMYRVLVDPAIRQLLYIADAAPYVPLVDSDQFADDLRQKIPGVLVSFRTISPNFGSWRISVCKDDRRVDFVWGPDLGFGATDFSNLPQ